MSWEKRENKGRARREKTHLFQDVLLWWPKASIYSGINIGFEFEGWLSLIFDVYLKYIFTELPLMIKPKIYICCLVKTLPWKSSGTKPKWRKKSAIAPPEIKHRRSLNHVCESLITVWMLVSVLEEVHHEYYLNNKLNIDVAALNYHALYRTTFDIRSYKIMSTQYRHL